MSSYVMDILSSRKNDFAQDLFIPTVLFEVDITYTVMRLEISPITAKSWNYVYYISAQNK